jgi:TPR repeat protein
MSIVKVQSPIGGTVEDDIHALYVPHLRAMACAGDIRAIVELGACYKYGRSVVQDDAECNKWWELAAAQGKSDTQRSLGVRLEAGTGVQHADPDAAFVWYMKAAVQGHHEGLSSLFSRKVSRLHNTKHDAVSLSEAMNTHSLFFFL